MEENRGNLFNTVCGTYEKSRPAYPEELYRDIFREKQLDSGSRVLEIGIGTGKATLPVLETGCQLTAIEPGDKLADFARNKFQKYRNILVCNQTFQEYECPPDTYDLIFSATAFHWIPEKEGYPKVFDLLKRGGVFARFGYHAGDDRGRAELSGEIQKLYEKYMQVTSQPREYGEEDAKRLADTAEKYGFTGIDFKLYHWTRDFSAEAYLELLRTYPDHMALEEPVREEFFRKICEAIQRHGGIITVYYTMDLQLARKP